MRSLTLPVSIILLSIFANFISIANLSSERTALRQKEGIDVVMPSYIAKIAALEFKGIFSDVVFLRTMSYFGGKLIRKEELTGEEWDWIYQNAELATDLDPYFLDPYNFGAMTLSWEGERVREANALLEKAFKYRDWDWTIPFYLGFNHFFFLQENEKAASYLMEAAKRPGAGVILPTFAARLAYKGKRTENSVIFLQGVLDKTEDESLRYIYAERLRALKGILFLEKAVLEYETLFNKKPGKLADLISGGVIKEIPIDPYGGEFYIDADGSIKTTSEMVHKKR